MYKQLRKGLNHIELVPEDFNVRPLVKENPKQDFYTSVYLYTPEQYEKFKQTGTIAGVKDVVTKSLVFDFDDKENPEQARQDAIVISDRLVANGIPQDAIRPSFSGNKGYHVEVFHDTELTPEQHKNIAKQLAKDLPSFDTSVYDHARPFRVEGSYNQKSGLHKIPLTLPILCTTPTVQIREIAKSLDNLKGKEFPEGVCELPEAIKSLRTLKEYKPKVKEIESQDIDWTTKPKWLSNCRFSLQSGNFGSGERNNALLCLAATYKNQGFALEHTYRILKGVAEKQSDSSGQERFSDTEIWNNIISQVYGENWQGGQYSCRELGSWLNEYCISLGSHKCNHREDEDCFIEIDDFAGKFTNFAQNIDKNRLKFGVPEIDKNVMVTTSMLVGLLGAPSAGKTTLLLNFLEQSNKDKIDSVFFSMDMGLPLVYLRLIQKHFGYSKERVFDIFLNDSSGAFEVTQAIKEKYRYTKFSFKTGLTVEKMREAVQDHEQKIGRKVKLVGIDYLERIRGPYSDPTANSGQVSNELTDMANDLDTCNMLLLQTQKQSGDPSDELLSMRNVKGASVIEQSCSVILTLSRPGFSPKNPEQDKFAMISTVKNRMDSLMSVDLAWNGLRGEFGTLEYEQKQELNDLRNKMKQEKENKNDGWGN